MFKSRKSKEIPDCKVRTKFSPYQSNIITLIIFEVMPKNTGVLWVHNNMKT